MNFVMRRGQRIEVVTLEGVDGGVGVRRRIRWQESFVKVPLAWVKQLQAAKLTATFRLAHYLLFEFWRNGGRPIRLANGVLARHGLTRKSKAPALRELEQMGLVKVERRPRKSPLVTLTRTR